MPEPEKSTTLWIKPSTKTMLDKVGSKGETYDDIIRRLLQKETTKIFLDIENVKLYRQGLESVPFFINHAYITGFKQWGPKTSFTYNEGIRNYGYWGYDITKDIGRTCLMQHIKDGVHLKNKLNTWLKLVEEQILMERKIQDTFNPEKLNIISLSKKSDKELVEAYHEFSEIRYKLWELALIVEWFDAGGEELIGEILNKFDKTHLNIKDFKILCSPMISTCIQKEAISLYTIALEKEDIRKDYSKLDEHVRRFFWIKNTWANATFLDKRFFLDKIKRLEEEGLDFKEEIEKTKKTLIKLREDKDRIRKNHPKLCIEVERAIEFFDILTEWREKRKKHSLINNHYCELFISELEKRTGVSKEYFRFMSPPEFKLPFDEGFGDELKERSKFCLFYLEEKEPGKYEERFVTGKPAREFIEKLSKKKEDQDERMYGNVANPGHVEGIAKVIFTQNELGKMEKGDILVAPCTRPEYLPAMKKAKAIITDEGGITSHAAIVSRELGVPCIVGLQHATDIIKDGDIIDVNANHGIVSVKKRR